MARQTGADRNLLAMALVGYEVQKARIEVAIAELRARLGTRFSDGARQARAREVNDAQASS